MRLLTSKINVEIKYKKVTANEMMAPQIVMRTTDGKGIHSARVTKDGEILDTFHWKYLDEDGQEVSSNDIHYYEVKEDGSEREVRPFDRTSEIKVIMEVPRASVEGNFLIEGTYELFCKIDKKTKESEHAERVQALYEEAERYLKDDLAGLGTFSWGNGFKQYYAIVYPTLRDEKFVWILSLTRSKLAYQNLMEIPTAKISVTQPPTLQTLPNLEALITI